MNDLPREKLTEIVATYGLGICDDPRRCEALLKDLAGAHKREISVLMAALRERVPSDLRAAPAGQPLPLLLARLSKRLSDDMGYAEEPARWAVESWALALGVVTQADLPPRPTPPPTQDTPSTPPLPIVPNRGPVQNAPWNNRPPAETPIYPVPPPARDWTGLRVIGVLALLIAFAFFRLTGHRRPPPPPIATYSAPEPAPASSMAMASTASTAPAGVAPRVWETPHTVTAVAISPDGSRLAVGGGKSIALRDAKTGTVLQTIAVPSPEIHALVFSPDGKTLAGSVNGLVTLWDAATGAKRRTLPAPLTTETSSDFGMDAQGRTFSRSTTTRVPMTTWRCLAFSPDGRRLAGDSGDSSGTLLWGTGSGGPAQLLKSQDANVSIEVVAFSPDGKTLAMGDQNGVLRLWDASAGRALRSIKVGQDTWTDGPLHWTHQKLNALAFLPDGSLATGSDDEGHVRIWDPKTGKRLRALTTDWDAVNALAAGPGARLVAVTGKGLVLLDAWTGQTLRTFDYSVPGANNMFAAPQPQAVSLSADGRTLAAGGSSGDHIMSHDRQKSVAVWSVAS